MDDAISREAAIDAFKKWLDDHFSSATVRDLINGGALDYFINLPSAEPKWTPVTEAHPPFTITAFGGIFRSDDVLCIDTEGRYVICVYDSFGNYYDDYGDYYDIIAWMPLPTPFIEKK